MKGVGDVIVNRELTLNALEKLKTQLLMSEQDEIFPLKTYIETNGKETKPLSINGYDVFYFVYKGTMPLFSEEDIDEVREYYSFATFNQYNFKLIDRIMDNDKAVLLIQHYLMSNNVSDLDNRNKKYLIDSLRYTGLISNDTFYNLMLLEEGFELDEQQKEPYHVAFLIEKRNLSNFLGVREELGRAIYEEHSVQKTYEEFKKKYHEKEKKKKSISNKFTTENVHDLGDEFW